ncbi:TOBE domain-containing protein [Ideonella paludis]|uniref:TOBE domain-containing protein n=1 Tax=Ideonella paludis TaxID=1233411 RepID=A0ABS5DXX0_9BURK|nr:TOBE domain-containing protein [Ideonella paludis]MBQ0935993.1 TOBE domain-containing protein [Ideonella paludis]
MARPPKRPRLSLQGSMWLTAGDQPLGGHGRIALLKAVAQHGSITAAAKAFGMSYKAAWDAIHAMNERASQPLVARSTGGRGGGGAKLTDYGLALIQRYEEVDAVHQRFVSQLDQHGLDLSQPFSLLNVMTMKTSARNQWVGSVAALRAGAVNDEVELALPGGQRLWATITHESTQALGLRPKQTVIALVKASAVMLATEVGTGTKLSARNQWPGTVAQITPGAVNAEVLVHSAHGAHIVAIITQAAVADMGLQVGGPVVALVQASEVVLGVVN